MSSIEEIYSLYQKHHWVFTDSRLAANGGLFFALKGDMFDGNSFALQAIADGANYAIVDDPHLEGKANCILVPDVLKALQQLGNHHRRQLTIPVLAITGTNGKTTTKELIASVLSQKYNVLATKGNLNNHIGVPLTLLSVKTEHEIAIIEMGANHPGEIEFLCSIAEPDYGIITNVGKAHLEGFGSFEGVKQTKSELYRFIASVGKGIFINIDNEHLVPLAHENKVKYTYASNNHNAELRGGLAGDDVYVVAKVLFEKGWLYLRSKLTGAYNLENILAAARIGLYFGLEPLQIQKGIEMYEPSNKRSQILKRGSNTILLDCYNANPSSMEVSVKNFLNIRRNNKLMILGDMLELGNYAREEHQKVVDSIDESMIDRVILIGQNFLKTNTPSSFLKFEKVDEMKDKIDFAKFENKFVLVKGSRGIKLEKILEWV